MVQWASRDVGTDATVSRDPAPFGRVVVYPRKKEDLLTLSHTSIHSKSRVLRDADEITIIKGAGTKSNDDDHDKGRKRTWSDKQATKE